MEDQIPSSNPPQSQPAPAAPMPQPNQMTPQMLELLKARAREQAIQMAAQEQSFQNLAKSQAPVDYPIAQPVVPASIQNSNPQPPQIVYLRRNMTIAELILVFAISCGIVLGIQGAWYLVSNVLPRLEIKVK